MHNSQDHKKIRSYEQQNYFMCNLPQVYCCTAHDDKTKLNTLCTQSIDFSRINVFLLVLSITPLTCVYFDTKEETTIIFPNEKSMRCSFTLLGEC